MSIKFERAVAYLRKKRIYLADAKSTHQYTPHNPEHLKDNHVRVTKGGLVMQPTDNPISAWFGVTELELLPLETDAEREKRLIAQANRKALSPEELFNHLMGNEHK